MTDYGSQIAQRIQDRTARVGIVGLGYVGLPTAVAFAQAGFSVVGVERDEGKRRGIQAGNSHVDDVDSAAISGLVSEGRLSVVANLKEAGDLDVIDVCVPTPLDKGRDPDIAALLSVVEDLGTAIRPGQLLVLTSTTYPGTTVELVVPVAEGMGLATGRDVFIAFAPERIDPGNARFDMRNTPKVVGGVTAACTELTAALFHCVVDTIIPVSSPTAAETVKLLENTFRSVNIGLANEVAIMCRYLDLDVWEVIEAAATKPYGFMPFYPGPGLGGHCIPVDPSYLSWKLRRLNYQARFIDLADDINRHMPEYVVGRAAELLNEQQKSIHGSEILLLGVAYKANVSDLRESPALDVMTLLRRRGAKVQYADPHVPGPIDLEGSPNVAVEPTPRVLAGSDLVIVTTAHLGFDWAAINRHSRLVLDTRGCRIAEQGSHWHRL